MIGGGGSFISASAVCTPPRVDWNVFALTVFPLGRERNVEREEGGIIERQLLPVVTAGGLLFFVVFIYTLLSLSGNSGRLT